MKSKVISKSHLVVKTMRYVGWALIWLILWDISVTVYYMLFLHLKIDLPLMPLPLLGSALVVLISFRNSSAYNRWWEARTLWGSMVNYSRSYARQILTLIDENESSGEFNNVKILLLRRHIAYLNSLAAQLRNQQSPEEVQEFIVSNNENGQGKCNFANDILTGSATLISQEYRFGHLDTIRLTRLESTLMELSNAQGGMERIANTPLPYPYVYFPRLFLMLFCLIVPLGLVESLGWLTPLGSTVVGFILIAIERVGTDLQSPFHSSEHEIQIDNICDTIKKNILSMQFYAPDSAGSSVEIQK